MSETSAEGDTVTESLERSSASPQWRRRRLGRAALLASLIVLFACGLIGLVVAAGLAGAQAGQQEAQIRGSATVAASVIDRFNKANTLMREGKYALAEANYEYILQYQPDNFGVRSLAATAIAAQTPTPTPVSPTPTPMVADKNKLLGLLRAAAERSDWDATISLADQLIALDDSFDTSTVQDLRYQALVERGLARLRNDEIEQGLYDLDQASFIQPLSDRAEGERQLAAAYQNALYYFGADWEKATALLEQLYKRSPGYRNVGLRLREAYASAGDAYASAGNWCPAAKQYDRALQLNPSTSLTEKQRDADTRCLTATPAGITGTASTSTTIFNTAGISGRLFYSQFDPTTNQYRYNVFDSTTSAAYQTGAGPQPNYRPSLSPDRTRVVYSIYQDNVWRVVIGAADGSEVPTLLTDGTYPIWGPNGFIAYQGCTDQCGIHLINPEQPSDIRRLTTSSNDINMQWSPSGDRLIYMSNFPGSWEIYTVTPSSGAFQQLTGFGASTGAPTFSPDGSRVAVISNRDGGNWAVWILNADGSNPVKLIDLGPQHPSWQSERLAWTP